MKGRNLGGEDVVARPNNRPGENDEEEAHCPHMVRDKKGELIQLREGFGVLIVYVGKRLLVCTQVCEGRRQRTAISCYFTHNL